MICVTLEEDQSLRMRNKRRNLSIIITFAIITFSILLKYTRLYTCPVDKYYVLPKGAVIKSSIRVINLNELLPVAGKYYITVLSGDWRRFGNLMFNYASLLGIAESNNMIPLLKLDSQETELFDVFNISVANCSKEYFQPSSPGALKDVHNHSEYAALLYDERTQNLPHRHTQLIGAYESKNYFTSHRLQYKLRQEFTFRSKYMERAERFITGLKVRWAEHLVCAVREVLVVGVHVRRGDMASPKLQSQGYTPPGPSYFYKAMAYITQLLPSKKHIVFLISSDDITWCHKYLSGHTLFNRGYQHSSPNVTHKTDQQYITSNRTSFNTDFTDTGSYVVDLAILSLCDHMIISAGSYGWWAAWLAGGITIYYEDWPKPDSMLRGYFKATDYYYPDWIPLK